jgi:FMN phosphatase YigB (HAD superfamily)
MLMESKNEPKGNWSDLAAFNENNVVKHYSFDFWNTIVKSNAVFKIKRAEFINNLLGHNFTIDGINFAFGKIGREYNEAIESGVQSILPHDLYLKVFEELKYTREVDLDYIVGEIEEIFLQNPPKIEIGFLNFLQLIKDLGKTISLTSNTAFISGAVIKKYLTLIDIVKNFEFLIFSDECGYGKPSQIIFDELYRKTKELHGSIVANEITHVGDNYDADIEGAKGVNINAFQFIPSIEFEYPRYSVHSLVTKHSLPISAEKYSRFKFGDLTIAKIYAVELFEYFINNHSQWLQLNNKSVVIYSSPYSYIPTSSYYLTKYFFDLLKSYLCDELKVNTQVLLSKINRCQTYSEDYGAMSSQQRYDLIKNDTYVFSDEPHKDWRLLFIDDISITGTHQRVIEDIMKVHNYSNDCIFLYYSKLDNPIIDPIIENELNYNYVNSSNKLLEIIYSDSFGLTTRAVKYILKLPKSEFQNFIKSLIFNGKIDIVEKIHTSSINNQYNKIDLFIKNHSILNTYIKKIKS